MTLGALEGAGAGVALALEELEELAGFLEVADFLELELAPFARVIGSRGAKRRRESRKRA